MIQPRNLIVEDDIRVVDKFLRSGAALSGYLAGNERGGQAVQRLEELWATKFGRRHAIAVNSATSGLLAACEAVRMREGPNEGTIVAVPALSMSATAAVPLYCGAQLEFLDVDAHGCALMPYDNSIFDTAIVTTLFGHPVDPRWVTNYKGTLIIDNAQGVLSAAKIAGKPMWSEQMGHITVTSMNVHKQINAGEMGIITTDDDDLAERMRGFINHGENRNGGPVGLNLRATELPAVLTLSQMTRLDYWSAQLDFMARRLTDNMPSAFRPLPLADDARHGRYCYAFAVPQGKQEAVISHLRGAGVPTIPMMLPLYTVPAFSRYGRACPVADAMGRQVIAMELTLWRYEDDIELVARAMEEAAKL